eukprot:NODE_477_length_1458_cov_99.453794_g444_i0.p1 GENE.NODE_477_length_1458_cov_99.453794_g444_i0~~NODE_477_length_1458_cov_99.453794_g444_i0.p1  ORF type:complete len:202 (-),score=48.79 NODE_477_length_1458_cov_99.453794_g444_i0:778-1383(-)
MAMAVAAGRRAHEAQARHAAESKRREEAQFLESIMAEYDSDGNRKLDKTEIRSVLTAFNGDNAVDEAVVTTIFKRSDVNGDGFIDVKELRKVVVGWKSFKRHQPEIDFWFSKFDKDKSGTLGRDELKMLLTSINNNVPPTDDEVDWVLSTADQFDGEMSGSLNVTEIQMAVNLWYSHAAEVKKDIEAKGDGDKVKSGCVVM